MHCSHCGVCCEKTEMMLSNADVERLEKVGYNKQKFMRYDRHGFARMKNCRGLCIFYDTENRRCKAYRHRPSGCQIYPVIYSEKEGIIVDELCPMKNTISKIELRTKGKKVMKLLQIIDSEAASRNHT
ncbi:MAG: YkgJ family cysteine cluster protein [Candidatus Bathyarchaeia archaeon]